MNCLNSVLLEGRVDACQNLLDQDDKVLGTTFYITSTRYEKNKKEETPVEINVSGNLADACAKNCTVGRVVRVVGRLKHYANTGLCIVAEHVEFRPIG